MRHRRLIATFAGIATCMVAPQVASAQTVHLSALRGLVPFSSLLDTPAGQAALAVNYTITGAIQRGIANQPSLQSFAAQQQQALKDATITSDNAFQLAEGFGTTLGAAYDRLADVTRTPDGKITRSRNISHVVQRVLKTAMVVSGADSATAKLLLGGGITENPLDTSAGQKLLQENGGTIDVFGKAYHLRAGHRGAGFIGNSRPFQTEKNFLTYSGHDFFGSEVTNLNYLRGPLQNATNSPAFPSGHTTYAYTESLLLALFVPERYPQMIARAGEYGNSRIVVGAHYAMDVIGGRALAYFDTAHMIAGAPGYGLKSFGISPPPTYLSLLAQARTDVRSALERECGKSIADCAANDSSRFSNAKLVGAFYDSTLTYGLPIVYPATAGKKESVAQLAPEAGVLLTTAFPKLTLGKADAILTDTEAPGGGFLDNGSSFGVYSRLDLYRAGRIAQRLQAGL